MGSVRLYGATSGYLELQAPDVAPDAALVLPSDSLQPGLVHLHTESFSAVSSVSIDDVFSSKYDNYKIHVNSINSATALVLMRMRATGSDNTAGSYRWQLMYRNEAGTLAGVGNNGGTSFQLTEGAAARRNASSIELFEPASAQETSMISLNRQYDAVVSSVGTFTASNQFDGFTVFVASGTFTGTLRVYGYRNS